MDTSTFFNKGESSIELNKTTRGYTWTIKIYNNDIDACIVQIKDADKKMQSNFPLA